jgi:hypothetical protein
MQEVGKEAQAMLHKKKKVDTLHIPSCRLSWLQKNIVFLHIVASVRVYVILTNYSSS